MEVAPAREVVARMIPNDPGDFTVARAAGALIGAFLSLVYIPPRDVKDTLARASFSALSGFVFGFIALDYMGWPETPRHWMAATVAVAGFSWILAGVALRILGGINKWPSK